MRLDRTFFTNEDVLSVAKSLIGKLIFTQIDNMTTVGRIVETEAYSYIERACHAYDNKLTQRTKVMFEEGGTSYVYLCYGIHKLFNVITNKSGKAEAVLIRAVEPISGLDFMKNRRKLIKTDTQLTSGPGKWTNAFGIDVKHNGLSLLDGEIWLEEDSFEIPSSAIQRSPRIGVGYAGQDALLPWRFFVTENPYVSKGRIDYNS
ncbi:MAG: DNA-3-methyladenine glycosylase [Bacteroidota bacterium]